jgi:hypothetical protein
MKRKLFLALMMCLPFAGFAQTQIINNWRDPNVTIQDPGIHKNVVAALINDQGSQADRGLHGYPIPRRSHTILSDYGR